MEKLFEILIVPLILSAVRSLTPYEIKQNIELI